MLKVFISKWKNYRHRLLPWLALNLRHRIVPQSEQINCNSKGYIVHLEIENCLKEMLLAFEKPYANIDETLIIFGGNSSKRRHLFESYGRKNREILLHKFGFDLDIKQSAMQEAGKGVFVRRGRIMRGQVVALYPGTIYLPYQPILLPSIGNPYIFRCADGIFIDGNYKGLSALFYRSIHGRDRISSRIPVCDISWLHLRSVMQYSHSRNSIHSSDVNLNMVINPLNVGQIINNANPKITGHSANLAYHEITVTFGENESDTFKDFSILGLMPNAYYKGDTLNLSGNPLLKVVALVATRDVHEGEELLSTYFTLVDK